MQLWPTWTSALQQHEPKLELKTGLLQLAEGVEAAERMKALAEQRLDRGLRWMDSDEIADVWPNAPNGGLHSSADGRINPLLLQVALRKALIRPNVQTIKTTVAALTRQGSAWCVIPDVGPRSLHDAVVVCTGLNSDDLLKPLGYGRAMSPVLGQALALQLSQCPEQWGQWPSVLVYRGFNLIPDGADRLLLGATVEPGDEPAEAPLKLMRSLNEEAPQWLRSATVIEHWNGLRARPVDRPAPLLEVLEPGLILASGHYRNGVLLAPATAEWVTDILNKP